MRSGVADCECDDARSPMVRAATRKSRPPAKALGAKPQRALCRQHGKAAMPAAYSDAGLSASDLAEIARQMGVQ